MQAQYPHDDDRVLQALWTETNALGQPVSDPPFVSVVIHHVPAGHCSEIAHTLVHDALPDLVEWLGASANAPEGWRIIGPHRRVWRWQQHQLTTEGG
jgi:hypothetical protein